MKRDQEVQLSAVFIFRAFPASLELSGLDAGNNWARTAATVPARAAWRPAVDFRQCL